MKKKHRNIEVNGTIYGWTVSRNDYNNDSLLKIWLNKKVIHEKIIEPKKLDETYFNERTWCEVTHDKSIKPSDVEKIIKEMVL